MLGILRMNVDECIEKYLEMAPRIFPKEGFVSRFKLGKFLSGVRGSARFDASNLESIVKDMVSEKLQTGPDAPLESPERAKESAGCRM